MKRAESLLRFRWPRSCAAWIDAMYSAWNRGSADCVAPTIAWQYTQLRGRAIRRAQDRLCRACFLPALLPALMLLRRREFYTDLGAARSVRW